MELTAIMHAMYGPGRGRSLAGALNCSATVRVEEQRRAVQAQLMQDWPTIDQTLLEQHAAMNRWSVEEALADVRVMARISGRLV